MRCMIVRISFILSLLLLVAGHSNAETWLAFEPEIVSLQGVLILEKHAGPPNYGEGPADSEETILVLQLAYPINVRGSPISDVNQLDIRGATTVQLQINWQLTEIAEFADVQVSVQGKLYTAHTGHHFHKLLMNVDEIKFAADAPACQAFETVSPGNMIYNDLVCQAIRDFEQENYRASIRRLEEAGRLILFEFPNFKILPMLALSYHRAGEREKAIETLEQARITLLIANGEIECVETNTGYFLDHHGQGFEHPSEDEIMNRMCGAIFDYLYQMESLEVALWRAELVRRYLEIRRAITGQ